MTFGEKLRELRKKKCMTQAELAAAAGVALKTITNYEKGTTYPQNRQTYALLAEILDTDPDYLRNENEERNAHFVAEAKARYGSKGKREAEELINGLVNGLFAGGRMSEQDMDAVMAALQEAYLQAKERNKKYTPKKYRKDTKTEEN